MINNNTCVVNKSNLAKEFECCTAEIVQLSIEKESRVGFGSGQYGNMGNE